MRQCLVAAVAAMAITFSAAAVATARPRITAAGAHRWTPSPTSLYFLEPAGGAVSQTTPGCPFVPLAPAQEAAMASLTTSVAGTIGVPRSGSALVHLTARITGTVQDVTGHSYLVDGTFTDASQHRIGSDLRFNGIGHLTLTGPDSIISGAAAFRWISGPSEFQLTFLDLQS